MTAKSKNRRFRARITLLGLFLASGAAAASPTRYGDDAKEVEWLDATYPSAAANLREGEALLQTASSAADFEKAAVLFHDADAAAPGSGIIPRRECQALTAVRHRADAIDACTKSIKAHPRSAPTLRAAVAARLSGSGEATVTDVGFALQYALGAREMMENEPSGIAGRCDIAAKLGDTEMLNACIRDLENVAPNDYETERAKALAATVRPGLGTLAAWLGLLSLIAVTLYRALLRKKPGAAFAAALPVLFAVALRAEPARAEEEQSASPATAGSADEAGTRPGDVHGGAGHLSKYPIDDSSPESSVPTAAQRDSDPLQYGYFIMDLGDHADWAAQKGDHVKAARLYRALAKAVPDEAIGFTKGCGEYEQAGDLAQATQMCAAALTVKGVTVADYSHYARLALLNKNLTPEQLGNLDAVVKHLESTPATRATGLDIECAVGTHEGDRVRLGRCAPALAALAPADHKTVFYEWALAMANKDYSGAERFVERARAASPRRDEVKLMESATLEALPPWRKGIRIFRDWRIGASAAVVLFSGLGLLLMRRRNVPSPL